MVRFLKHQTFAWLPSIGQYSIGDEHVSKHSCGVQRNTREPDCLAGVPAPDSVSRRQCALARGRQPTALSSGRRVCGCCGAQCRGGACKRKREDGEEIYLEIKGPKPNKNEMRKWEIESAMSTLQRAAEIQKNAKLMNDVKKMAAEKAKEFTNIAAGKKF